MSSSQYKLFVSTVRVNAPTTWTDEQAEAIMPEIEARLQAGLEAAAASIRSMHDDLTVEVDV